MPFISIDGHNKISDNGKDNLHKSQPTVKGCKNYKFLVLFLMILKHLWTNTLNLLIIILQKISLF